MRQKRMYSTKSPKNGQFIARSRGNSQPTAVGVVPTPLPSVSVSTTPLPLPSSSSSILDLTKMEPKPVVIRTTAPWRRPAVGLTNDIRIPPLTSAVTYSSLSDTSREIPSPSELSEGGGLGSNAVSVNGKETLPPMGEYTEFSFIVPKDDVNPVSLMRFNGCLGVEPLQWSDLKMVRENSKTKKIGAVLPEEDKMPKFGAGSEYGREEREAAKRRKYGGRALLNQKKNKDGQPWLMKTSETINEGKNGTKSRKFRGAKEGGISENTSYFIFAQSPTGYEAYPVNHWFNFTPIQRYKSLTAEEAEKQFEKRNQINNYFSVMVQNRLKVANGSNNPEEDGLIKSGGRTVGRGNSFKVSEMDDWEKSDEDDSDEDGVGNGNSAKKMKKKGLGANAEEDSGDGDDEGREVDYITDTSDSESEDEKEKKIAAVGVDQEDGLKNFLDSDSAEEEEDNNDKIDQTLKKPEESKDAKTEPIASHANDERSQESFFDDEEDEMDGIPVPSAGIKMTGDDMKRDSESTKSVEDVNGGTSAGFPSGKRVTDLAVADTSDVKRNASSADMISGGVEANAIVSKKPKIEVEAHPLFKNPATTASEGITEEAVRKYLTRKPTTVAELLRKFMAKKLNIPKSVMVQRLAYVIKKVNPVMETRNQKLYLSCN